MKFNVRDVDGKEFEVEEIDKTKSKTKDEPLSSTSCNDEDGLTPDEIKALKNLAAVADKLLAGLDKTQDEDIEEEEEEEIDDAEEEEISDADEEIEEVIDTNAKNGKNKSKKTSDSIKKSASAIEKRKLVANDTIEEDNVSNAWAKRYGGNK